MGYSLEHAFDEMIAASANVSMGLARPPRQRPSSDAHMGFADRRVVGKARGGPPLCDWAMVDQVGAVRKLERVPHVLPNQEHRHARLVDLAKPLGQKLHHARSQPE